MDLRQMEYAQTFAPAGHADCVPRLDDPRALQPPALTHRDPVPSSRAAQAFLRLALARLSPRQDAESAASGDTA